jgi:hypothetical protein
LSLGREILSKERGKDFIFKKQKGRLITNVKYERKTMPRGRGKYSPEIPK